MRTPPLRILPSRAEMERARLRRDPSYDGIFYIAVRSTGIFCRPSCPARRSRPENVQYFGTIREAILAGYRPCKRCRPLETNGRVPDWVADLLARIEAAPDRRITDDDLVRLGIQPARARRFFSEHYGMTFHAFARARRLGRALEHIRRGADLDEVALSHGYESHSGFRDAFTRIFGQPPGRSRSADQIILGWMESPVGPLVAGATDEGICLLEFTDRRMLETQLVTLRRRLGQPAVPGTHPHLEQLRTELTEYFEGARRTFTVPLVYRGTEFQCAVWRALLDIPYGGTRSYEQLADALGRPGAQRAVGRANGSNRIAIVIPCHRVVNKDGSLGGYGGGLWRKQMLLELEQTGRPLTQQLGPLFSHAG